MPDTNLRSQAKHVNAKNRNSYLNIICIKLVIQVKKKLLKIKIRTFDLIFKGF